MRRVILCAVLGLLLPAPLAAQANDARYVATYLDVRPASTRQGTELATRYVTATRAEPGNLRSEAFQEIGQPNRFVIIETWKDQSSIAAHEKAAHTAQFRDGLKAIHRGPYDQRTHSGFAIDPMPSPAGRDTIFVVTHVDVPGARREEAETLMKRMYQPSLQDAGHVRYDIYQQVDPRTNHFTVFAAWRNRSAFDAYGGTAHWLQFRETLGPMLGALYDERLYQPILGMPARAADDPHTGHWKMDVAKSRYVTATPPKSSEVTITPWGKNGVSLTVNAVNAKGEKSSIQYNAEYDGKPYPRTETGAGAIAGQSVTLMRIDAQTVERIVYLAGKPVGTERWVISKDGKTRTVTQSGVDSQGKPINNVQVYVKQ